MSVWPFLHGIMALICTTLAAYCFSNDAPIIAWVCALAAAMNSILFLLAVKRGGA